MEIIKRDSKLEPSSIKACLSCYWYWKSETQRSRWRVKKKVQVFFFVSMPECIERNLVLVWSGWTVNLNIFESIEYKTSEIWSTWFCESPQASKRSKYVYHYVFKPAAYWPFDSILVNCMDFYVIFCREITVKWQFRFSHITKIVP